MKKIILKITKLEFRHCQMTQYYGNTVSTFCRH